MRKRVYLKRSAILGRLAIASRSFAFVLFALHWCPLCEGQSIILRDLTRVKADISTFDSGGIELFDGRRIGWDEVLQGSVEPAQQEKFDKYIREIGLPVFRLKTRIRRGDWWGAGKIADPMFELELKQGNVFPDTDTKFLACLATMQSRLRSTRRIEAVLPYLEAVKLQSKRAGGIKRLPISESTINLSNQLIPIWFDATHLRKCAEQLKEKYKYEEVSSGDTASPALMIYLASMHIEIGEFDSAKNLIGTLTSRKFDDEQTKEISAWKIVLEARIMQKNGNHVGCQTAIESNQAKIVRNARPVALYYLALSKKEMLANDLKLANGRNESRTNSIQNAPLNRVLDNELSKASLLLLRIPALYGEGHKYLSAAAIYQAAEIAKDRGHSIDYEKLKEQLFRRYPRTYHGRMIKR